MPTYPNLWDTLKAMLKGKLIALSVYIKNLEKSHTNDLIDSEQQKKKGGKKL